MSAYETAGESNEWHTPAYSFEALGEHFDLDVACPPSGPLFVPCTEWYCTGALEKDWHGFVWMNPPFGHQSTKRKWLAKFFEHGDGIALLPDRTSAPWFQEAAKQADALLFISPKVKFYKPDGTTGDSPGTGTTLFATGDRAVRALHRGSELGFVTPSEIENAA